MDSRQPPPQGPPPSYAFVTKVYKRSLRPVIIAVTFMAGLWSLFSGIGFFRNVPYYDREDADSLKIVALVLGSVYMLVTVIQAFGLFAGATQKLVPARIFAWLSVVTFIAITGIGLGRVVIHFTQKDIIIDTCANSVDGTRIVYPQGFWGPVTSRVLDRESARDFCNRAWERGSWSEIVAFIATSLLAALFASVAFGFYRQLLDPSSVHNAWRAPSTAIRTATFPSQYAPPYNPEHAGPVPYPTYGGYTPTHGPYSAYPAYGPPPGPPPSDIKPPGYTNDGWEMPNPDNKDDKPQNPFADQNPFEPPTGNAAGTSQGPPRL